MSNNQAIKALLQAAANPALTEEQAGALINEAMRNAEIAYGASAGSELIRIVAEQTIAIYERGADILNGMAQNQLPHNFGGPQSQADARCLLCGFEAFIPDLLNGKTSMWGCSGRLPESLQN